MAEKNKISESSNFIKCCDPSKKNDHCMFVQNVVNDLVKSFDDCVSKREKNNQIKKYEPRNESCVNLNEKGACSANKKKLRILNTLKYADALNNHAELKDIEKFYRKRSKLNITKEDKLVAKSVNTLNVLKECRDSKSLPCGSRKVNISGDAFKFHPMSVADAKKTVSSHSIHEKSNMRFCSEDLRNTKCEKSCASKDLYLPEKVEEPKHVFNCIQCYKIFRTNEEFYNHLCAGKRKVGYVCDICEEILNTATEYAVHVKDHLV